MTPGLFDTHSHLYDEAFDVDRMDAVRRALDAGVGHIMLPACELADMPAIERLAEAFPENILIGAGIHPENLPPVDQLDSHIARLGEYIENNRGRVAAIGEIGIDLYWDDSRLADQLVAFRRQCELALEYDLPVIIHCRKGLSQVLDVLNQLPRSPRGVFHCFDGTAEDVAAILGMGDFYFGIGGIVTFKKSKLPDVLQLIPAERLLLETDAPYLAPVPMRGKRNESAYVCHTAHRVAEILGVDVSQIAAQTTENAIRLFGR